VPRKYAEVAATLRAEILSGQWSPASKLPPELQLAERLNVSQGTVRRALAILQSEGLLEARQGSGVYVRSFRPILRDATRRLAVSQWGEGRSIWNADLDKRHMDVDRVEVTRSTAPSHIEQVLGTADVWVRDRRYLVEGRPVMLATSYLPAEIVDGSPITQVDSGEGGTYARLMELGYKPANFIEDLRKRTPSADEAEALQLPAGADAFEIARIAFTEDGRAVEVNEMVADARVYVFRYRFTS